MNPFHNQNQSNLHPYKENPSTLVRYFYCQKTKKYYLDSHFGYSSISQINNMQHTRTTSEVNLYSPFLLKFEGRMTQLTKKGTLTTPPPLTTSFHRDIKKLTEKRANNILLDLNQIKSKNAREMENISHRYDDSPTSPFMHRQGSLATAIEHPHTQQPTALTPSIISDGGFSEDFRRMLRQLDNMSPGGRKNK